MTPDQKLEALTRFCEDWGECSRCPLATPSGRTRRNIVFGEGNPDAKLLVVGDSPSAEDDETGTPFSGDAGEVIDFMLRINASSRDEIFITHLVSCRATSEAGLPRDPLKAEIDACRSRLSRIIEIIDPFVILAIGPKAYKALTSDERSFASVIDDTAYYPLIVETPGTQVPVQRLGFATYPPETLLNKWTDAHDGKPAKSGRVWRRALLVADLLSHKHYGTPLVDRGKDF